MTSTPADVPAPADVTVPGWLRFACSVTVDDRTALAVCTGRSFHDSAPVPHEMWLLIDGCPVGYIKTYVRETPGDYDVNLSLCDIEVHPHMRGQGIAKTMIEAVESWTGYTLYTTGGYTPLGYAALAGKIPVHPYSNRAQAGSVGAVEYDDMTFVHDWATMHPRFSDC